MAKPMGRSKIKRLIFLLLSLAWMGTIFALSAQQAQQSSQLSGGLIQRLLELVMPGFESLGEAEAQELIDSMQTLVRKCAHMGAYALLGFLVFGFMSTYPLEVRAQLAIAMGICVMYAASDEIHQLFVPGRSGEVRDVIIDSLGAAMGCAAHWLIYYVNRRRKARG